MEKKIKLKMVELFAGTGAFSLAFEKTNKFETIFANDFDKGSKKIFDANFNIKLCNTDLHNIDIKNIPKMDILTAGFPCQPFSISGEKKGFDDARSNVFWKIIEIMKKYKPTFVILENVKNLQSHDNGNSFKIITDEITKLKYYYKYQILNTCEITNIPQNRERIYIICFKKKKHYDKFIFPKNTKDNKLLKDILKSDVDDKYYYKNKLKVYNTINNEVKKNINTNTIYQYRRFYVRENKNNVCPTLTANMGGGGHNVPLLRDNKGIRKLTPRECFILQGFPEDYIFPDTLSDSALYKLAGNAVSVPVVEKIAESIVNIL